MFGAVAETIVSWGCSLPDSRGIAAVQAVASLNAVRSYF